MESGEKTLLLAVLAQAILDVLGAKLLGEPGNEHSDRIDSAVEFVLKYPSIARKLKSIQTRQELEAWMQELEKALNR